MPVEIILNVRNKDDVEIKFNEKENTSSLEKKSMESQTSLQAPSKDEALSDRSQNSREQEGLNQNTEDENI